MPFKLWSHHLLWGFSFCALFLGAFVYLFYAAHSFPTADDWGFGLLARKHGPWNQMLLQYENQHGRYFSNFFIGWFMSRDSFLGFYRAYFVGAYLLFLFPIFLNSIRFTVDK